jgi:hypothetical protein
MTAVVASGVVGLALIGCQKQQPGAKGKEHGGKEHAGAALKEPGGQEHGGAAVAKEHGGQEHGGATATN